MHRTVIYTAVFLVSLYSYIAGNLNEADASDQAVNRAYPRLMGMNVGAKNYDNPEYIENISRLDIVILGFYAGWKPAKNVTSMRDAVKLIKALNSRILVGQYTVLNESYDQTSKQVGSKDKYEKINAEDWWLKDARGVKMMYSPEYHNWEINITSWSKPDAHGMRYPQWVVGRDNNIFFSPVPEFDIWFLDNVNDKPSVKTADWDRDGVNDKSEDARIQTAHRFSHVSEWDAIRRIRPNIILMANASSDLGNPEYRNRLNGAFLEALMGKAWSIETNYGWDKMMQRYWSVIDNVSAPGIVGFNVWGSVRDFRKLRYGLTSCLLDNGYFSFTDSDLGYSSVPWFDEYAVDLGNPIDQPARRPWHDGIYRRKFEKGMVLVNTNAKSVHAKIEVGYHKIRGQQDPKVNTGESVAELTIPAKDGIVLIKDK